MKPKILEVLSRNIKNIPGKRTNRKIVVLLVDDYGAVRTKDNFAKTELQKLGIPMEQNRFSSNDTLACSEDLQALFDTLTSVRDFNNNFACFTAFAVVANPDFEKIKNSDYTVYYREPLNDTFRRYGKDYESVLDLWIQGIKENIFYPAYHGTEHINVQRFMNALQSGHKSTKLAFEYESLCVPNLEGENEVKALNVTFDIQNKNENKILKKDIEIGLQIFENLFGYRSKHFIAGAGIYNTILNKTLAYNGIKYINVNRIHTNPVGNGKFSREYMYTGKMTKYDQYYLIRNCIFEPMGKSNSDSVSNCLKNIEAAFNWGKPALISSHRVNFIGHFDKEYRNNSLSELKILLTQITKRWPDVEFMNADQMADTIFT